jgi:hypothetical protein
MRLDYLMALANGQNTAETRRIISAQRYQRLAELAGGATSPADWNYRVMSAWGEGLLTTHDRDTLYGHFENKDNFVDKLQTAAEQTRAAIDRTQQGLRLTPQGLQVDPTAVAGQEETAAGRARGGGQVQTITLPDKDHPGQFTEVPVPLGYTREFFRTYMQEYQRQHGGALPPRSEAAPSGGPGASTVTNNNPGNLTFANQPGATRTPGSQFATFPDAATGVAATADQLVINQDQHGMQSVTDQVHRWVGPKDVRDKPKEVARYVADTAAALGVDPNARVDWHDPAVQAKFIQAQRAHETTGTLAQADVDKGVQMAAARRSTATQYAGPGVPPEGSPAAAIATGMVGAGAAPGTLTAGPPGSGLRTGSAAAPEVQPTQVADQNQYGFPGHPVLTPQQQKDLEVDTERRKQAVVAAAEEQKKQYGKLGDQYVAITTAGETADATRARLYDLQHAAEMFTTGTTAAAREAGWKAASTALRLLGIEPPAFMSSAVTGAEVINKEGNQLAQVLTSKLGSGEAATVFNSILAANPNLNLSKGGFKAVVDSYVQGVQRDRDLYTYMNTWLAEPKHNNSLMGMLPAFQREHPVETYASRVLPFPMPMSGNKPDASKMIPDVIYKNSDGSKTGRWNGNEMELQ